MTDPLRSLQANPLLRRDAVEALRKLLHVAEAGATVLDSWPTSDCPVPGDRDYELPIEVAESRLKLGLQQVTSAIAAIVEVRDA
jgi:hypothetical protein